MDDLKTGQWVINGLCNQVKAYKSRAGWTLWSFILEYLKRLLQNPEMATKVKIELEEEVKPSTSGGGTPTQEPEEKSKSEESMELDEIDDEYLANYCETAEIIQPMTVSKELFYTDSMVARNYKRLSPEDKK